MTIPAPTTAFDEIIAFLASAPSADAILAYEPSTALQQRMSALLQKNRDNVLTTNEETELDELLRMNRFMSRLKAKTKQAHSDR